MLHLPFFQLGQYRPCDQRHQDLMMSGELNAAATGERRALHDVHARPVVTLHVAVARREVLWPPAVQVPCDRQGFEKHLGHYDRATEVEHDAAVVEIRQDTGKALEIAMTRRADH